MADSTLFSGISSTLMNDVTPVVIVDGESGLATPVTKQYNATASPVTTQTAVALITVPAAPTIGRRTLCVRSTLDVVLTIAWTFVDAFGNVYSMVTFTMVAGNVTPQVAFISSAGAISLATAPTVTVGAYANLAARTSSGEFIRYSATSPTVGSVQVDVIETAS